ncbi:Glutamyl-tRNA(Gln) amidotransferase, C subunit [Elusimicrobium minutum Pei191]|uniref:Glutamyl-tRNA(Gln) amidotransferase subunit C n=1 Tax=Elusimicrobium minutum (strain Pei191) TaxID=445932 RepID=B2KAT8_ELUMP|nr:Asp-tRNA(Asn)/Glu-tRNA(Gln) amidotransferase subunit GatC [Elusimicrobium minutum]ACC97634.1 Glutamyl-tRNA(Gln) amidotransferase, C subunit [Elusimicrobium minutum Pei191]
MDTKYIEGLALSAKLKFTQEDIKDWNENMSNIFQWLDQLEQVDTSGAKADFAQIPQHVREDIAVISQDREAIVCALPEVEDNMAKVKKVL